MSGVGTALQNTQISFCHAQQCLERDDLGMTPRDPFVIAMSKAFEPIGLARDDYEIFTAIAEKLDIKDEFTEGRSAADWLEWWDQSRKNTKKTGINMPSYKQFVAKGWYQAPSRETDEILLADFFRDPVAFPLSTPSGKMRFSQRLWRHLTMMDVLVIQLGLSQQNGLVRRISNTHFI